MKVKNNKKKTGAIKEAVLKRIKGNQDLTFKLINETGKSFSTIYRWINTNSDRLTQAGALSVICKELGLTQDQVLN